MTTYNGAAFLAEQLDSIFAQSRPPDELIVCDDQSSDATQSILCEYAARSPFTMKVVVNEQRLGSTKNFEKAIDLCTGEIIFLSDQDDLWKPHKVATIWGRFMEEPDLGLAFSNGDLIDANGKRCRGNMWRSFIFNRRRQSMLTSLHAYDLLVSLPFVTGATIAFRSKFKSLILPIPDDSPTFVHDRWIAVMIAAVGRIAAIGDHLIAYRLHSSQQLGVGKLPLLRRYTLAFRASSDQTALQRMQERLANQPTWVARPHFELALRERQKHLAVRLSLHRNPIYRLAQVAIEYGTGRYNKYPLGFRHALKDFVRGTQ